MAETPRRRRRRNIAALTVVYVITVLVPAAGLVVVAGRDDDPPPATTGPAPACVTREGGALPDQRCTPGEVDPAVDTRTACTQRSRERRRVSDATRRSVLVAYGFDPDTFEGEVDHLVPLALGGSNGPANLWPQPGRIPNPKDTVEVRLWRAVCDGELPLDRAQEVMATDWRQARR